MVAQILQRSAFRTSRLLEFFSERELNMQIGHGKRSWPVALLKELIDNSLDACEGSSGCSGPLISFGVEEDGDSFFVVDNGPGIPSGVIESAIDYSVRVSDKAAYVSPTRGQLGNALKCLWAAPFVATSQPATIEVDSREVLHRITVDLDRIDQKPVLLHEKSRGSVKNGSSITVNWPDVASLLGSVAYPVFYRAEDLPLAYSLFNPHAELMFFSGGSQRQHIKASNPAWKKWRTNRPTSAHWYSEAAFRNLICANLSAERSGVKPKRVRDFVAEFDGLSGTKARAAVLSEAGLSGSLLSDLLVDGDIDHEKAADLLAAMVTESREVDPKHLGIIGREHIVNGLISVGCDKSTIGYRQSRGVIDGVPFLLEMAMGADTEAEEDDSRRRLMVGLNWSPTLNTPTNRIEELCGEMRVEYSDPVTLVIHIACPVLRFKDRGKTCLDLPDEIQEALDAGLQSIASKWKKLKRQADRSDRAVIRQLKEEENNKRRGKMTRKDAAFAVMKDAYLHASGGGKSPANARQIMYAARPQVMELTGGPCWAKDSYFTQNLLIHFIEQNPELTANWDVIFDARGRLIEPHTGKVVDLGTLAVRRYAGAWFKQYTHGALSPHVGRDYGTNGPDNRYQHVLFVEKEGFQPLLDQAKIAERFDIGIMSTKGMSNIASRALVDRISQRGVTVLVLHDFDKAGFSIVNTLQTDCKRYKFKSRPNVIDLGLRLSDVEEMGLPSEPVRYKKCKKDPRLNLSTSGATKAEQDFLVMRKDGASYVGNRVELNAMTSPQFIAFIERKLEEHSVQKVIPSQETLESAMRAEIRRNYINQKIDELTKEAEEHADAAEMPENLTELVAERFEKDRKQAWDDAISSIAAEWE